MKIHLGKNCENCQRPVLVSVHLWNRLVLSKNITDVVIGGMMTHMCVDATVRAAKDLGYKCTIIQDACATKDLEFQGFKVEAEKVQAIFLAALTPFYATIISTDEYIKSCLTTL